MRDFASKEGSAELQQQLRALLNEAAHNAIAAGDETAGLSRSVALRQVKGNAATSLEEAARVITWLLGVT